MSLDLELDDAQLAVRDAVARFCAESHSHADLRDAFTRDRWRELAALGVLALATPEGDGGAGEAVAAMEALGAAVFPGPLAATLLAGQLLPAAERRALVEGETLVSLGHPPLMPFAPEADLFLAVDGEGFRRCEPRGPVTAVDTLGGERWGRVELALGEALGPPEPARTVHDLALAAYLGGAGGALLDAAAEHARTRTQFGRAIGEFQAVAHPLADVAMGLDAARTLVRRAAWAFDTGSTDALRAASSARLSARAAALEAAHVGHQVFGAQGITTEGAVFRLSRRIRQLASQPAVSEAAHERLLAPYLGASA